MEYALEAGVGLNEFWSMTPAEILLCIKIYGRKAKQALKQKCADNHSLAVMLSKGLLGKLKGLYDEFPDLFEEERNAKVVSSLKASMLRYAEYNNAKRKAVKE